MPAKYHVLDIEDGEVQATDDYELATQRLDYLDESKSGGVLIDVTAGTYSTTGEGGTTIPVLTQAADDEE